MLLRLWRPDKDRDDVTWRFVTICQGNTRREAWEDADGSPLAQEWLPGPGEQADFRLIPLSSWGEEFSATGKAKVEREVKGL